MKNKVLLITTIIFFLIVNTIYYWEGKLGLFAFPAFLILVIIFLGLGIALIRQIYFLVKENFSDKKRLINIGLLALVLTLTFLRPFGLVDFEKLEGDNILIAEREGGGNCMTILKLKDNYTFSQRGICFGVTEIKGEYHLKNDTIYFSKVSSGIHDDEFDKFAVIKESKYEDGEIISKLVKYKDLTDTIGRELWITKNDLNKLNIKKPNH